MRNILLLLIYCLWETIRTQWAHSVCVQRVHVYMHVLYMFVFLSFYDSVDSREFKVGKQNAIE